jgi:hypothetical protein
MGLHSWTAKTERTAMSAAQWLRLALCVLAAGALLAALFGTRLWPVQLGSAVVIGTVLWILLEILWLIWKDEHPARNAPN